MALIFCGCFFYSINDIERSLIPFLRNESEQAGFSFVLLLPRFWKIKISVFVDFALRATSIQNAFMCLDLSLRSLLELLVLENAAECTGQHPKCTSEPRVMIIVHAWFAVSWRAGELGWQWAREVWLPDCKSSVAVSVFHGVHPPFPPPPLVQKCSVGIQYKIDKSQGHLPSSLGSLAII